MNCYLRNRTISAAVPRTAAAYPAQPGGEVCCGGKRGSPPALLRRLALCSPGTPHPANPPCPRLTAPPHPHHPAPPQLSLPITPRQPPLPAPHRPDRPCGPSPGRLAPLRPASPLSAKCFESTKPPPRFASAALPASNSGPAPTRRRRAPPRPICPFPLRQPRPGWPGQASPPQSGARPQATPRPPPHPATPNLPCPPLFPAPELWGRVKTQQNRMPANNEFFSAGGFWAHSARSGRILGIWFSKRSVQARLTAPSTPSKYPEALSLTRMQGNTVYLTVAAGTVRDSPRRRRQWTYCKTVNSVLRVPIRILCRSSDSDLSRTPAGTSGKALSHRIGGSHRTGNLPHTSLPKPPGLFTLWQRVTGGRGPPRGRASPATRTSRRLTSRLDPVCAAGPAITCP